MRGIGANLNIPDANGPTLGKFFMLLQPRLRSSRPNVLTSRDYHLIAVASAIPFYNPFFDFLSYLPLVVPNFDDLSGIRDKAHELIWLSDS